MGQIYRTQFLLPRLQDSNRRHGRPTSNERRTRTRNSSIGGILRWTRFFCLFVYSLLDTSTSELKVISSAGYVVLCSVDRLCYRVLSILARRFSSIYRRCLAANPGHLASQPEHHTRCPSLHIPSEEISSQGLRSPSELVLVCSASS